jgi:flagellar M-ring protein FliF
MPEQLIRILTPVKAKWDNLTRRQQIQLVSVTAALLLVLILFLFFSLRTRWGVLINNSDFNNISHIASALDQANIRNRPSDCYTRIYVPTRNILEARGIMLGNPNVSTASLSLPDALNLATLGTTEAQSAALLLEASQSSVRDILILQEGVIDAAVIITPQERNLMFRPNQPRASLAVTLVTNRVFSAAEGRRMAEFLSRMVLGLELENITIIDQRGNGIFTSDMVGDNNGAMDVWSMRNRREQQTTDIIEAAFSHSFDNVIIASMFVYDNFIDEQVRVMVRTAPSGTEDGLPTFMQTSQSEAEGMLGIPWGPGLGANMNATPAYYMGEPGAASASHRDRTVSFVHDEYERITQIGPGGMDPERSSIAITGIDYITIRESDWFERNPDATRADWLAFKDETELVTWITYGDEIEQMRVWIASATGLPVANVAALIQEIISFIDAEETTLPISTIIMLIVLALLLAMLLIALLARKKEEEEEEVEPELSVEDLLATTQLEEAKEEAERLKEIDYETENEIKKQIDKFVNEKPEAVAALLRNWLNAEEW